MPLIYHEGYCLGDSGGSGTYQLIKDTVGWTGKNLLKNTATSQTINGVTFTVNADKSVTVNGTATADATFVVNDNFVIPADNYILSTHETSDGNNIHYSVVKMPGNTVLKEVKGTDEQPFTVNYSDYSYLKFTIWVRSGTIVSNKTAYPMLRRADILDDTYEPYHESVETMYEEEIHGVNLAIAYPNYALLGDPTAGYQILSNKTGALLYIAPIKHNTSYIASKAQVGNRFRIVLFKNKPSSVSSTDAYQVIRKDDTSRTSYEFTNTDYNYVVFATAGEGGGGDVNTTNGMIRKADIDDPTYRPYNPQAIQNQLNAQGVLGAKNLLPYPYAETSLTKSGITFTVNSDGSVTANGTATAQTRFQFALQGEFTLPSGDYILTDGTSDSAAAKYMIDVAPYKNGAWIQKQYNTVNGVRRFTLNSSEYDGINIYIQIRSGITVSNLTFYPMLRLASDPDDTYQPYAMTNRELTDNVSPIEITDNWLTLPTDITKGDQYTVFKIGKLIIVNIVLCRNAGFDGTEFSIPINSQYQPIKQINANAIFQPTQYITEGSVGYLYVADKLIIRNMQSTPVNFCKINIAYICK